jgi:fatty-acyl-CoA synthase
MDDVPTIAGYVLARSDDDRPGLVSGDRVWTWAEVVAESRRRAGVLAGRHADGPFHVGVLLENTPEYVFLLFGAALAGATVVGLNPTRRGAELEADIRHCDCEVVLTDAGLRDLLPAGPATVVDVDGEPYLAELEKSTGATAAGAAAEADTLYLLIFTAGSTGAPKAVRMTQGRAARTALESARAFGPEDILYCAMPLFHGNALVANLFPAVISGASVVLRRRFSASAFLPDVRRHGCTYFNYVGRALAYIVALPETPDDRDHRLRWALGSEASPQNIAEFKRRFGCPVFEGYGSSENAVVISPGAGAPPGALGRPRPGMDVAILDPKTGTERAAAQFDGDGRVTNLEAAIGEIVGRNTAGLFEGYYRNPDAERERLRGGWYWTGDLGYQDSQGFIYFAGRTADWLRVDGENFSAAAVERILNRLPGCGGAAVYGVPDPLTGDAVMAALELADPGRFEPDRFAAFLAAQADLGTKWAPRFLRALAQLPVTGAGKVDKPALRAAAWVVGDPLWWRPGRALTYEPFGPVQSEALRATFAAAGRAHLWPARP